MNKKQKKIFFCVCMIFFLFLIVTIYLLKQKSPYEYLKEQKGMTAQTTPNECLEEIRFDNKYIAVSYTQHRSHETTQNNSYAVFC